ncbi:MAG: nucleotide exchange factor GrpE [Candidatus Microsaccharimonas sossegonensis]|uniref:Protein GrpE n=1 Tax=Candidatus Microsaccharimonas sossegonensis TaxID=2506948 RepID=A0A4Q0AH13_9BACT|nr:MAG: nucleotide exchange factor GrpE [Candidatus Microsaccharimonas sossegonensis]
MADAKKTKKNVPSEDAQQKKAVENFADTRVAELTLDLKRTRADFENYRKRVDAEKVAARESGQASAILKLLPVIDNIERAVAYTPEDLKENSWVQSVAGLVKHLEKSLGALSLTRIEATPGTTFDPEFHEAIQFDETATGDQEVIAEELQAGYILNDHVIRHAMVKVTKQ